MSFWKTKKGLAANLLVVFRGRPMVYLSTHGKGNANHHIFFGDVPDVPDVPCFVSPCCMQYAGDHDHEG
jgi:hypothetical protein